LEDTYEFIFVVTKLFRGDAFMPISVQHIRHATSIISINGKRLLIDPMLSEAGKLSPVHGFRPLKPPFDIRGCLCM